jgi:hypothetical protein
LRHNSLNAVDLPNDFPSVFPVPETKNHVGLPYGCRSRIVDPDGQPPQDSVFARFENDNDRIETGLVNDPRPELLKISNCHPLPGLLQPSLSHPNIHPQNRKFVQLMLLVAFPVPRIRTTAQT